MARVRYVGKRARAAAGAGALGSLLGLVALAPIDSGQAASPVPTCHGLEVTVPADRGVVRGTPGRDVIRLVGRGTVLARGGSDVICGSRFADRILGGRGADVILGGRGADQLYGGPGVDRLFGEGGGDIIRSGSGKDVVVAGSGEDRVLNSGNDRVSTDTYSVSIRIPADGLSQLAADGLDVGLSRNLGAVQPIWLAFEPLQQNTVTWTPGNDVLFASSSNPLAGVRLGASATRRVRPATTWTYTASRTLESASGGTRSHIGVSNQSGAQAAFGLAQNSTLNGAPSSSATPTIVRQLENESATTLASGTTVAIYPTNLPSGTVLSMPPADSTVTTLSSARPTAAFSYDASTGSFVSDTTTVATAP